jgi:hypothetical protein
MKILAVVLSLLAAAGSAAAQTPVAAGAAPGEALPPTVRVHLGGETVQGFLRGRSKDELVVFTSDGRFRHLPLADVRRFEVRSRTGTHMKRGALIGVFVWASVMGAASLGALDDAGLASWESGAILLGSTVLGAAIGRGVPQYGWVESEPSRLGRRPQRLPGLQITLRLP